MKSCFVPGSNKKHKSSFIFLHSYCSYCPRFKKRGIIIAFVTSMCFHRWISRIPYKFTAIFASNWCFQANNFIHIDMKLISVPSTSTVTEQCCTNPCTRPSYCAEVQWGLPMSTASIVVATAAALWRSGIVPSSFGLIVLRMAGELIEKVIWWKDQKLQF